MTTPTPPLASSLRSTVLTVTLTIVCFPCICVIGSLGLFAGGCLKILEYETPRRKRKKEKLEVRRRTPRVLGPRLERHLTIGRDVGVVGGEGGEDGGEHGDGMVGVGVDVDDIGGNEGSKLKSLRGVFARSVKGVRVVKGKEKERARIEATREATKAKTDDQTQSLLFALPLEIRRQIWEDVVGGYTIHLNYIPVYKRFDHTRCKMNTCIQDYCKLQIKQEGARDEWGLVDLLALLSSCRMV
jgi:hypothetical protein